MKLVQNIDIKKFLSSDQTSWDKKAIVQAIAPKWLVAKHTADIVNEWWKASLA